MMGVPILDERSRRITIFGGKLRTALNNCSGKLYNLADQ
jgi:hypothetical protein